LISLTAKDIKLEGICSRRLEPYGMAEFLENYCVLVVNFEINIFFKNGLGKESRKEVQL
jgi:hypothetical protein